MAMTTTMKPREKGIDGSGTVVQCSPPLMKGSSLVCSAWLTSLKPIYPRIAAIP